MDNNTEIFNKIAGELAHVQARVRSIAQILRAAFPQATVQHAIDFPKYESPLSLEDKANYIVELFIEIGFEGQNYLCWWIDVTQAREGWNVEASLRRNEGNGEDSIWRATYTAETLDELFAHLSTVLDEVERFAIQKGRNFV